MPHSSAKPATPIRRPVRCECGAAAFDGELIKTRVVRLDDAGQAWSKCRCKRWNQLPLHYRPPPE